jgi:uncharacterized circularly permuted ATP-grasp superfamily protein/uncharacterized alpha-E superfamily protein
VSERDSLPSDAPHWAPRQPSLFGDAAAIGYRPAAPWDELASETGQIRPHWQFLIDRLAPFNRSEMTERRDEAGRLLRQNGVSYTIYGDPQGVERPWPLDLLPLIIPDDEWCAIESGAAQRARLLNALLGDIYGAQRILRDGLLPASLLHADPGYLRPCCGIAPPRGTFLHFCAIDLGRSRDGRWWVLADRAQSPSGAGYALENRSVVGRVLSDCLADGAVEPIADFFAALHDGLLSHAPRAAERKGRPRRLVLLTPGPYNETYFEHAYLARQLGITLVEGADLTVRDRRVFLKTLSALEPVDVIWRRLDDDFCDPLELRQDSSLGVAGLTEAARAGTVTVANALGSGILEAMAFKPFLPGLSRALLGETLTLPDVASWWCGGEKECRFVGDQLHRLVVKPAFPALGREPVFGAELSAVERTALAKRIAERPLEYVGQERVELSSVPVWENGRLTPRPLVLRVFVAATADGFAVMPGGLTRTSPASGTPIVSMQRGGGCKDTWIVSGAGAWRDRRRMSANIVSLRATGLRLPIAGALPSRAADGLFWVGRYAERANGGMRLLRTLLLGVTDGARPWTLEEVQALLGPAGSSEGSPLALLPVIEAELSDASRTNGILANLQRLAQAAGGVRDYLPPDCWRVVAALSRVPALAPSRTPPARLLRSLDELMLLAAALAGTIEDNMQRDAGWRFFEIGRRLERAMGLLTLLRRSAAAAPPEDDARRGGEDRLLAALLAASGMRGSTAGRPDGTFDSGAVLGLLLLDPGNPFSVAFQVTAVLDHLRALPAPAVDAAGLASDTAAPRARELAQTALHLVYRAVAFETPARITSLDRALAPIDKVLPELSNLLTEAYFLHVSARPA